MPLRAGVLEVATRVVLEDGAALGRAAGRSVAATLEHLDGLVRELVAGAEVEFVEVGELEDE